MAIALLKQNVQVNELPLITMTHVNVNNNNSRRHVNNLGGISALKFIEPTTVLHMYVWVWQVRALATRTLAC